MKIALQFVNDDNLYRDPDEPGIMFNPSSNVYVQLRALSMAELRQEWKTFNTLLRRALLDLFSMKISQVRNMYGALDISERGIVGRTDMEFGLAFSRAAARFTHFRQPQLVKGLVAIGIVAPTTPHGRPRQRMRDVGGVGSFIEKLEPGSRLALIAALLESDASLDELFKLNQTSLIRDREIGQFLASTNDAAHALERIARNTHSFFNDQQTVGRDGHGRGSGRIFGWAWFSQYLSMRGIWLQPVANIRDILNLYPRKIGPIAAWMAVSANHRRLADLVWSRMEASRGTSAAAILNVFLALAQSSNAFTSTELAVSPLVHFKQWTLARGVATDLWSSSANHLFKVLCQYFGATGALHPMARFFFGNRRIGKVGVKAFAWCDHPNRRNTTVTERCLGRPVTTVPLYIKDWAEHFRELLASFGTKSVANEISDLNTWLIFLLHLGEKQAPKSFLDISRSRHVNDLTPDGDTYVNFLRRHFPKGRAYRAASTLAKAWKLAATRDHFHRSSPFDVLLDRVGKPPRRHAKSVRRPLDQVVMDIIVKENRRNDFAFARTIGKSHPTYTYAVKNPTTQAYEQVFFPLLPIIIDVILHSGLRKYQARWLDSGEGDEFRVDPATKIESPNPSQTATKGRREGFLQVCEFVERGGRRRELGMFVNTNKTGSPYSVPWIDAELAANIDRLAKLQATYNPIRTSIPAKDPDISELYGYSGSVPSVFPLFRNPSYDRHLPISSEMVSSYWLALLKHCEPIVERELGYSYPLLSGGVALFDIHALRVTTVTVLQESGVPLDVIQSLVGHSSVMMTCYYRQVRYAELHRELNKGYAELGKRAPSELVEEVINEAITSPDASDPIGLALLQQHRSTRSAPFDVFGHGICPGGDCATGGKRLAEGRYAPVFRQRACSRCRFRVTGPKFIDGLTFRVNCLSFELDQSKATEQKLNAEADMAEDSGKSPSHLRALARREKECRDAIHGEWSVEHKTVYACKAAIDKRNSENQLYRMPAQADADPNSFDIMLQHVHPFQLVQNIVVTAHLIPELQIDLPPAAEETRDNTLYRILHHNNLEGLLRRVDKDTVKRAFDTLGGVLLANVTDQDKLQEMIDGAILFQDVPALQDVGEQLRQAIVQAQTIPDHGNYERQI